MRLGVKAALVDGVLVEGYLTLDGGAITAVGVQPAAAEGTALPGFVDAHINGIAGVDFLTAGPEDYGRAGEALAGTGVVAYQPTFVSSPLDAYDEPLRVAAATRGPGPLILGVHLEGPFLSPDWPGAHDPAHLLPPDPAVAVRLVPCDRVGLAVLSENGRAGIPTRTPNRRMPPSTPARARSPTCTMPIGAGARATRVSAASRWCDPTRSCRRSSTASTSPPRPPTRRT